MSQKPAIVFICHRIPYPPIKGERIQSFNIVRHLTRRFRVFVGTFVDDPDDRVYIDELRKMVAGLHVSEVRKPWAFLTALPRWMLGDPLTFAMFRSNGLRRWLASVEERESPVAFVTHSSNVSAYAAGMSRCSQERRHVRRFLHFSDVDSVKFSAYAEQVRAPLKWIFEIEAARVAREEQRLTELADCVALVSDEEADLLRSRLTRCHEKVVTLPNGVDTALFNRDASHEAPFVGLGATFVFTGAMDYPPNVQAVVWFANNVFPRIRQRRPEAQFLIVGSKPAPAVTALSTLPGVIVTGRVPSVAAYLAHAQVSVAPLQIARGIQNKVLEAMAMSLPVVVSPGALTGISARPGVEVVLADGTDQWVDECVGLLEDPARARQIGAAGRRLILERYDWESQFRKLDAYLDIPSARHPP